MTGGAWALYSLGHFIDHSFSDYSQAILNARGAPVIIPSAHDRESMEAVLSSVQGLILSGGADIHPCRYGEEPLSDSPSRTSPRAWSPRRGQKTGSSKPLSCPANASFLAFSGIPTWRHDLHPKKLFLALVRAAGELLYQGCPSQLLIRVNDCVGFLG